MKKQETIYDYVFEIYGLKKHTKALKEKYRKTIRKRFEKFYPGRTWKGLSPAEKVLFACHDIRKEMFQRYFKEATQTEKDTANENIDKKIEEVLRGDSYLLVKHNRNMDNMFEKVYYNPEDSNYAKKKKYEEFCSDLSDINSRISAPGYEEWVNWNKDAANGKTPPRLYDYVMSFYNDMERVDMEYTVQQSDVDHVVIEILKKVIEDKLEIKIEIDIPKIKECLFYLHNPNPYYVKESERLPSEFDSFLKGEADSSSESKKDISREEQERLRNDNRYLLYLKMLENLDFYSEERYIGEEHKEQK